MKTPHHTIQQTQCLPQIVIIGGGFAGLNAAKALAKRPVQVTLIDRTNHHLFTPLLYQTATAALSPGDIAQPIRALLRRQRNVQVLLGEVTGINPARQTVQLADGEVPYDQLILAAGTQLSYFGHDEWAAAAPGLKTLDDALEVRRRVLGAFERAERATDPAERDAWLTFVIIGGGPTGVELAGAIAEIARHTVAADFRTIDPTQARIILVEGGPRILSTQPERLSAKATQAMRDLGVAVRLGERVSAITPTMITVGDEQIATHTTLWAAGIIGSPLGKALGVPTDRLGRVQVGPDLTIPGHANILVAGDLAAFIDQRGKPLPGVAAVAMQQGRTAAENSWRSLQGTARQPFQYIERPDMATIGRGAAITSFKGVQLSGRIAWLLWLAAHLFFLNGFDNRVLVFTQWLWSLLTYERGARLITTGKAHATATGKAS